MTNRVDTVAGRSDGLVIPAGMMLVDAEGLLSIEQLAAHTGNQKNTLYYWRVGRGA